MWYGYLRVTIRICRSRSAKWTGLQSSPSHPNVIEVECVIGLDYQLVPPVLLNVKGVPLIIVGELPVFGMLRNVVFIVKEVINDYNERIRQDSPADDPVAFYNKMLDYVFEFAKANQKLIRSAIRSDSLVLLLNIMSQQVTPDICQKLKQDQARGRRMPASPEVMATFFAGGISESLRSWFTSGKKRSEEDIKKQLSDIMRTVYQVENIQEQAMTE